MQEKMNCVNHFERCSRSGIEFSSERLSHNSSHPMMIPSSRSWLSRDKKIAAWHMESIWSTSIRFWKPIFYVSFTQRSSSKNWNLTTCKETEKQSLKPERRRPFTRVKTDWIMAQFQCRLLQQDRWIQVIQCRSNYLQIYMVGKYRNCNSTNSRIHHRDIRNETLVRNRRSVVSVGTALQWLRIMVTRSPLYTLRPDSTTLESGNLESVSAGGQVARDHCAATMRDLM